MEHPLERAQTHTLPFPSCSSAGGALSLYRALSAAAELLSRLFPSSDRLSLASSAGNEWSGSASGLELAQTLGREAAWGVQGVWYWSEPLQRHMLPHVRWGVIIRPHRVCASTHGSGCLSSTTPPAFSFILFPQSPSRNGEHRRGP